MHDLNLDCYLVFREDLKKTRNKMKSILLLYLLTLPNIRPVFTTPIPTANITDVNNDTMTEMVLSEEQWKFLTNDNNIEGKKTSKLIVQKMTVVRSRSQDILIYPGRFYPGSGYISIFYLGNLDKSTWINLLG